VRLGAGPPPAVAGEGGRVGELHGACRSRRDGDAPFGGIHMCGLASQQFHLPARDPVTPFGQSKKSLIETFSNQFFSVSVESIALSGLVNALHQAFSLHP
jgi:hypothetical protein